MAHQSFPQCLGDRILRGGGSRTVPTPDSMSLLCLSQGLEGRFWIPAPRFHGDKLRGNDGLVVSHKLRRAPDGPEGRIWSPKLSTYVRLTPTGTGRVRLPRLPRPWLWLDW